MKSFLPSRLCLGTAFLLLFAAAPAFAREPKVPPPPPAVKPSHPALPRAATRSEQNGAARAAQNQEHLAQWIQNHRTQSLPDQQRSLQNEPGFRELPRQTQQRELEQLGRLSTMNPQQRSRMLERTEALERLTQPQRQQWRGAVEQLNALPVPRKRLMLRAILDLREMPPEQREQVIDSQNLRGQFSDSERALVRTLLTAEPYAPGHPPNEAP